ncbi:MAG: bifunctional diaminohydroxyphosphoribosylaminopyrimidine deaminase/5-amino-6-(5-phosphoribosylamino)uracil reductase RibD [Treponema sp.]|nr:bifunctional diaminohydroxyphosphoribosylaminopyrimidine deaminase/5-amino-6-(5-phosphoribosylamino)uracil reductase RibD [Candidatus Treponema equi]
MSFIPQEKFMRRAIELAKLGGGHVHPNPLVGAVIVRDGRIIAEGYHHRCGDLHAERDCLKNAKENNVDVSGAEMYVTLEPCCHTGKQPPCTQAVIESGIKTVVIGSRDPNELVNGKGVKQLEDSGITVIQDFLRQECDTINQIFFHYIKTKTPYVIVKYAMTADGKTSLSTGESKWITGDSARENVHRTRGTTSAIMCGIKTVIADDPMLNCRVEGSQYKQPVRVILDRNLELPLDCSIVKTAGEIPVMVFCGDDAMKNVSDAGRKILADLGVEVVPVEKKDGHMDLEKILAVLGERKIDSVFVESGGTLNASLFFSNGKCLVNEVHCYVAPKIAGGINGSVHSPVQGLECESLAECVRMELLGVENFGGDVLLKYRVV